MKIVIIEDEPKTANNLAKTLLRVQPQTQILRFIESVEEGKVYFQNPPEIDLIFSDIQLGDGLCFEIFEAQTLQIPIIFCTAYNEYALRAFKTFGIDYILKPFSSATIQQSLEKYQTLATKSITAQTIQTNLIGEIKKQIMSPKTTILVFRGDKVIPLETENIAFFYIENSIIYAFTFDENKLNTNYKLEELEQKVGSQFFRANRQFLVNRKAIKEASQYVHRKLQVHLNVPFSNLIIVGKEKVTAFIAWLEQ